MAEMTALGVANLPARWTSLLLLVLSVSMLPASHGSCYKTCTKGLIATNAQACINDCYTCESKPSPQSGCYYNFRSGSYGVIKTYDPQNSTCDLFCWSNVQWWVWLIVAIVATSILVGTILAIFYCLRKSKENQEARHAAAAAAAAQNPNGAYYGAAYYGQKAPV